MPEERELLTSDRTSTEHLANLYQLSYLAKSIPFKVRTVGSIKIDSSALATLRYDSFTQEIAVLFGLMAFVLYRKAVSSHCSLALQIAVQLQPLLVVHTA
jgi:hypothetical protein